MISITPYKPEWKQEFHGIGTMLRKILGDLLSEGNPSRRITLVAHEERIDAEPVNPKESFHSRTHLHRQAF